MSTTQNAKNFYSQPSTKKLLNSPFSLRAYYTLFIHRPTNFTKQLFPVSPGYYGHSKRYKQTMVTKRAKFWGVSKVNYGQMRLILIFLWILDYRQSGLKVRGLGGKKVIFLTCLQFSEQVQAVHTNELYGLRKKQLLLHVQSEKRLSKEIKINRSSIIVLVIEVVLN